MLRRFIEDRKGATAVEYGLIVAALCVALLGVYRTLGQAVSTTLFDNIAEKLPD